MINKKIIARNFSGAAKNYEDFALLQKKSAQKLCDLSRDFIKNDGLVLDLGSGTGYISQFLNQEIINLDLSFEMLQKNKNHHKINGDIENLPFKNEVFDVIISSFALQWVENKGLTLQKIMNILKKDGIFAFCAPMKKSFEEIEIYNKKSNANFFIMELFDEKSIANMSDKILKFDLENNLIKYDNVIDFFRKIKKIGANYSVKKKIVNKNNLKKLDDFFLNKCNNIVNWQVGYFILKK